jgi:hypothetical protein
MKFTRRKSGQLRIDCRPLITIGLWELAFGMYKHTEKPSNRKKAVQLAVEAQLNYGFYHTEEDLDESDFQDYLDHARTLFPELAHEQIEGFK